MTTTRVRRSRRRSSFSGAFRLKASPFVAATLGVLVLSLIAGGASQPNNIGAAVTQIAALALLPWVMLRVVQHQTWRTVPFALAIIGLMFLIPLLQLAPLPPEIWTRLPGRQLATSVYEAAGHGLPWRPLSLTPDLTLSYALSLAAPVTMFLAWTTFDDADRRLGLGVVLTVVALGLLLGVIQVAGGQTGYLYETTNRGSLVGFFANRNHEATLLLCALPFGAVLITQAEKWLRGRAATVALCLGGILVIAALLAVRSRAGLVLLAPTALASFAIIWCSGSLGRLSRGTLILAGAAAVALLAVVLFGVGPILDRLGAGLAEDQRFAVLPDLVKAARDHLPWGGGLGSTESIYRSVERLEQVGPTYLNRAHNDYVELWIDAGLLAGAVLLAFLAWFGRAAFLAWRPGQVRFDPLAAAGVVVIGVVLLHSAVDYPVRTHAIAMIFAIGCALCAPGRTSADERV